MKWRRRGRYGRRDAAKRDDHDRSNPMSPHDAACGSPRSAHRCIIATRSSLRNGTTRPSPTYRDAESTNHPLAVAGRAVLDPRGEGQALRDRMLAIYEAANEDPDAFCVTSRYVVATARRR
jgi:hypothetical protein